MSPSGTEATGAGFNVAALGAVVADDFNPAPKLAEVVAIEDQPYASNWTLSTDAVCA